MSKAGKVLHWAARILSVPIVLVWGFLVIAYAFGPERSVPNTFKDSIAYVAMIVSFLALAISWKWELVGSLVALAAVIVGAVYNLRGFFSLNLIIPFNAVLFLLSWWFNRTAWQE